VESSEIFGCLCLGKQVSKEKKTNKNWFKTAKNILYEHINGQK
jgi:hypothetical protein